MRRYHRFIFGVPLVDVDHGSSPMVVWEGSHRLVREAFEAHFAGMPLAARERQDITDFYRELRREIFAKCTKTEITAAPGEAWLVHRQALHGIAPWSGRDTSTPRTIVYFRPEYREPQAWFEDA
jgi:hypothetical protein